MGKATTGYYNKKKAWSIAKDNLLKHYLNAYMSKLFHTNRAIVYLDCFAGAGKFGLPNSAYEEKEDGSPLIALNAIQNAYNNSKASNREYFACFNEPIYHKDLITNLQHSQHPINRYRIYNQNYPEVLETILGDIQDAYINPNLFCYLDPFGVKHLQFNMFDYLRDLSFNSLELLINFNSFGFFRFACSAWETNINIRENELNTFEELIERDPMDNENKKDCLNRLDGVMGTDKWRQAIEDYRLKRLDGYEVEEELAILYKEQIKQKLKFQYVLSIPIRLNESCHPKYRMVYATDHEDGAKIMGDVMCKQQDYLYEQQMISCTGGPGLFDREELLNRPSVEDSVIDFLKDKGELKGSVFYARFYAEKFITSKLVDALKNLEEGKMILIRRNPQNTASGRPSKFYTENKNQHFHIRLMD